QINLESSMLASTHPDLEGKLCQSAKRTRATFLGTKTPGLIPGLALAVLATTKGWLIKAEESEPRNQIGMEGNVVEITSANGAANEESQTKVTGGNLYPNATVSETGVQQILDELESAKAIFARIIKTSHGVIAIRQQAGFRATPEAAKPIGSSSDTKTTETQWHPPWKFMRVVSGHLGWMQISHRRFYGFDHTSLGFLAAGKAMVTLTHHKKSVRALTLHPTEFAFTSRSAENIKQWKVPGELFIQNFEGHKAIINYLTVNVDKRIILGWYGVIVMMAQWRSGVGNPNINFKRLKPPRNQNLKQAYLRTPETHPIQWKPSLART
ncbi:8852_t:CDS:2, partial [Paraglomus occultum]